MPIKVLVTGGAGFIGHHLVRGFVARGAEVVVLDDFSTGRRERLAPVARRIRVVEGSILDEAALDAAVPGCDVILHEAAIASVARSVAEPRAVDEVNVGGTIEVMLAAVRHGVRRVVFAGSSAVYGVPAELPCRESHLPEPRSPYGVSKLAAERYLHALGEMHGVQTVSLRYFNAFGPGQDPDSEYAAVVPRFVTAVLGRRRPTVNGSTEISRDYVYVENVVNANILAAECPVPPRFTCNIASGRKYTLLELLDAICSAAGERLDPVVGPPRLGDIQHSVADISEARRTLGYEVTVPFADGLARTVAWYRDTGL